MRRVLESTGVRLEPEVRFIGEDPRRSDRRFEEWERASNYGICHRYRLVRRGEIPGGGRAGGHRVLLRGQYAAEAAVKFAELCLQAQDRQPRVAIVIDSRGGSQFQDLFEGLDAMKAQGGNYKILFLECGDQELARRYKGNPAQASAGGGERRLGNPGDPGGARPFSAGAAAHRLSDRYLPSVPRPAPGNASPSCFWPIRRGL